MATLRTTGCLKCQLLKQFGVIVVCVHQNRHNGRSSTSRGHCSSAKPHCRNTKPMCLGTLTAVTWLVQLLKTDQNSSAQCASTFVPNYPGLPYQSLHYPSISKWGLSHLHARGCAYVNWLSRSSGRRGQREVLPKSVPQIVGYLRTPILLCFCYVALQMAAPP